MRAAGEEREERRGLCALLSAASFVGSGVTRVALVEGSPVLLALLPCGAKEEGEQRGDGKRDEEAEGQ